MAGNAPTPVMPEPVAVAFSALQADDLPELRAARALIFEQAEACGVGQLTETLKWGQPSYLTEATKAGSTIRLGLCGGEAALLFTCNTNLVESFRADFGDVLRFGGNRAVMLKDAPPDVLAICIARALTYHRNKRRAR